VNSVIRITGIGDHDRLEWLIRISGIRRHGHAEGPRRPCPPLRAGGRDRGLDQRIFGATRFEGTDFEETNVYREHRAHILGLVHLRKLDPVMFAPNLARMLESHMTFAEAAISPEFMVMEKSRLFRIKSEIWNQLTTVL
jgi:hypothetical protein